MNHRRDPYLTSHSRQRAMFTDLKILQFQEALERQERSVKKLRAQREDPPPEMNFQRRGRTPAVTETLDLENLVGSAARREPKAYVPLNRQVEPALSSEERKQWEYLQSMDYQRYLQEILCSTGNEKALVQKIKSLRSNSIYLSKVKSIEEEPLYYEPCSQADPYYTKIISQLNYSKIAERQAYSPQLLNCRPYLQKNSMLDQICEDEEVSSEREQPEIIQLRQEQPRNIRIEEDEPLPLTPHCRRNAQDNAKTVIRTKANPPNTPLMASTKVNLGLNQAREREKKEFIQRQLTRYDKENRQRTEITPSKSPIAHHRNKQDKIDALRVDVTQKYKNKVTPSVRVESASLEQSQEFYKKDRMDVSAASLYNIDFKLDRPGRQDCSFARCASAVNISTEKSISRSKSNTRIKMSVVTPSGRPGR